MSHDPKQLFIVSTISREGIAEELSTVMDDGAIAPDDPRLTDAFCEEYAAGLYAIEADTVGMSETTQVDAELDFAATMLEKLTNPE